MHVDDDVEGAAQAPVHVGGDTRVQLQLHLGVLAAELSQQRRQHGSRIVIVGADPHLAAHVVRAQAAQGLVVEADQAARVVEQRAALFGELHGAPGVLEQRGLGGFLQALDLLAHGGLRPVQGLGRRGVAAVVHNRHEHTQQVVVEHTIAQGIRQLDR